MFVNDLKFALIPLNTSFRLPIHCCDFQNSLLDDCVERNSHANVETKKTPVARLKSKLVCSDRSATMAMENAVERKQG